MKKILFLISTLFLLGGCASNADSSNFEENDVIDNENKIVLRYENRLPTVYRGSSNFTTYLLLSPFGSIDIEGVEVQPVVSDLFYENTVVWKAEPGTDLPTPEQVKSSVPGAAFRGWAYYDEDNDNVFPDYYTKVPVKEGLALKAIFDGKEGGIDPTPGTTVTYKITDFANWVPNDGAKVFVWTWGGDSGNGAWTSVTLSYQGENNNYNSVTGTFNAPSNITGFNIARCSSSTTLPNWQAVGDAPGRVYNKTADVMIRPGVLNYTAPEFVEYEYRA